MPNPTNNQDDFDQIAGRKIPLAPNVERPKGAFIAKKWIQTESPHAPELPDIPGMHAELASLRQQLAEEGRRFAALTIDLEDLRTQLAASQESLMAEISKKEGIDHVIATSQKRIAELEVMGGSSLLSVMMQISEAHRQREEAEAGAGEIRLALIAYRDFKVCDQCQAGEMCENCDDAYAQLHVQSESALSSNAGKELTERIKLLEAVATDVGRLMSLPHDEFGKDYLAAMFRLSQSHEALDAPKTKK